MKKVKPTRSLFSNLGLVTIQFVIIVLAFLVGWFGYQYYTLHNNDLNLLIQAKDILNENSLAPLPDETKLQYGMIRGMIQTINDPFTCFVEPPEQELHTEQLAGRYGGIGITLEQDSEGYWLVYPFPDSPAETAGLFKGDRLLSISELPITAQMDSNSIRALIHGPVGEKVHLTLAHPPLYQSYDLSIKRAEFAIPSVTWNLMPDAPQIGILHVNIIANTTSSELIKGIEALKTQGSEGFILDLRNNGGGLVEAGIDIARLFTDEGLIINEQFKGEEIKSYTNPNKGAYFNLPLAVLINQNTASAAEIAAGVLQSQKRALLIGTQSYGKNSIQYVFELIDGSSIHVTSGRWWIPDLTFPLQPDILIQDDPNGTLAPLIAIDVLTK